MNGFFVLICLYFFYFPQNEKIHTDSQKFAHTFSSIFLEFLLFSTFYMNTEDSEMMTEQIWKYVVNYNLFNTYILLYLACPP